MYIINSFLQKKTLHESRHGIIMVAAAYVLSVILLVFGSDTFYNISTKAEENNAVSAEEAQITNYNNDKIINPYGLPELNTALTVKETKPLVALSGDTNWLFGYTLNDEEYNDFIDLLSESSKLQAADQKSAKEEVKKQKAVKTFAAAETKINPVVRITKEDVKMLERIVEAEASGEDMKGKILIANVIFNRMADEEFPDTVEEVIFQKVGGDYQFSPAANDSFWDINISDKSKTAVERALSGEDYSEGALYFMSRKRAKASKAEWFDDNLEWLFKYGGHEFYKEK